MASSISADYAEQLWTLSNAVAAFSLVQTLAFAYSFKDSEFGKAVLRARGNVVRAILLLTAVYVGAILTIDAFQVWLLCISDAQWPVITVALAVTILKLAVVVWCGIFACWLMELRSEYSRRANSPA